MMQHVCDRVRQSPLKMNARIDFFVQQETNESGNDKCGPDGDHESQHISQRSLNRPDAEFCGQELTGTGEYSVAQQKLLQHGESPQKNSERLQPSADAVMQQRAISTDNAECCERPQA
jgi:hypothetical protein